MENIYFAVLGFLWNAPEHGYDLYKEITDQSGFSEIYFMKIGRLYSILNKLEDRGCVTSKEEVEGNRPPKKIFKISAVGKTEFQAWIDTPIDHGRDMRIGFMMKLFFSTKYEEFSSSDIIDGQIAACKKWLNEMEISQKKSDKNAMFSQFVHQFRRSQIDGYINWLNWCRRRLDDA